MISVSVLFCPNGGCPLGGLDFVEAFNFSGHIWIRYKSWNEEKAEQEHRQ